MSLVSERSVAGRRTHVGLFLIALATLMFEVLLTRIFSVTMWYHFAFVAVSLAMFGMTAGAILVYLFPAYFTPERAKARIALFGMLFAVLTVTGTGTHLVIPFLPERSLIALYGVALTYLAIALPFVCSGICVCLALTCFPRQVSTLYAADLTGAALGCVLLVLTLRITDGLTAVFVVAALAAAGAACFAAEDQARRLLRTGLVLFAVLTVFSAYHTVLSQRQTPWLRVMWAKGVREGPQSYEKWNSFSRVRVGNDSPSGTPPIGWGMSPAYPSPALVHQRGMNIDSAAYTVITRFRGDLREVQHLKWDVTNAAHYLRRDAKVLVVGAGGGRDVLSALAFEQRSVIAVEINGDILDIVNRRYGDFTGHLDRNPRVTFVNDEARSYLARQSDRYDILQISLIDTWAATAAGAFVLSEHSLYTVEAWQSFLQHLTPGGILSVSRWYFRDRPGEAYRITALATQALLECGVRTPRAHLLLLRTAVSGQDVPLDEGVATLLVSPQPFSPEDIAAIEALARRMRFELVLSPTTAREETFARLASGRDLAAFTAAYPLDISPPTDDRPFFFYMLRPREILDSRAWQQGTESINLKAAVVLGILLLTVVGLTFLCIIVPLLLTSRREVTRGRLPLFLFFAAIGSGFMCIEMSQMQRLIVFLGHPTYGLTVVLFALLLFSGLGSRLTHGLDGPDLRRAGARRLTLLLAGLVAFGLLTPFITTTYQGAGTPARIALSVAVLLPLGMLLGMPFPLGVKTAARRAPALNPWLWGINGATSVCASVIAVIVALHFGIAASFWTGVGCYVVALLSWLRDCPHRSRQRHPGGARRRAGVGRTPGGGGGTRGAGGGRADLRRPPAVRRLFGP